jgi:hypothetical protein
MGFSAPVMPILLPLLDVLFVGLVGQDPGHIDRQVQQADARLKVKKIASADLQSLASNADGSADVVKKLGADGIIAGELVSAGARSQSLRLVIYNATGAMTSMSEVPLGVRHALNQSDLAALKANLDDEVTSLLAAKTSAPTRPSVATKAPASTSADPAAEAGSTGGDDDPLGKQAAPKATADATDPAGNAGSAGDDPTAVKANTSDTAAPSPGAVRDLIGADLGFGGVSREFAPGPSTVRGYGAGVIPEAHFAAYAHPFAHATATFSFERTLGMQTFLEGDGTSTQSVQSNIQRWEGTAQYSVLHGPVDVSPMLGVGTRSFAADAPPSNRSPDGQYTYVIIGGVATYAISPKLVVHGQLAVEPLVAGAEPTIMMVGASVRYGLDVGVAAEYHITDRIYARASADYQRLAWSWNAYNGIPQGSASDSYPTASLAVGARY